MSQIHAINTITSSIHNGQKNLSSHVKLKHSKFIYNVLSILYEEGYISNFKRVVDMNKTDILEVRLKYYCNTPAIRKIERVYNGYISSKLLNYIDLGLVTYIISTSKGIISGKEARRLRIGGIILLAIW